MSEHLTTEERETLATSLRWHFRCYNAEPEKSYDSLGIENAVLIFEDTLTARLASRDARLPAAWDEGVDAAFRGAITRQNGDDVKRSNPYRAALHSDPSEATS